MNERFLEKVQIAQGFLPVAMNSGANNGDWISMKNYRRLAIVFFKGAGTAGDDPTITVKQATDVSGSSPKALGFTRIDKKQAASNLLSTAQFTKSTSDSPASNDTFNTTNGTWTNSDLAEQPAIVVIDIKAEDLDIDNGYTAIQASIGDVGTNAQLGCVLYIGHEPKYGVDPMLGMIAD